MKIVLGSGQCLRTFWVGSHCLVRGFGFEKGPIGEKVVGIGVDMPFERGGCCTRMD